MEEVLDEKGKVVGKIRGAKGYKRWEPKTWLPIYEAIVALSCTGLDNESVGKRFGYGKQQVSNILNTEQAKKLIKLINDRLRDKNVATLGDRMERMQEKAMGHIEYTLDRPSEDFKNPFTIFDRSLQFLKSSGKLVGDNQPSQQGVVNNIRNAMFLTNPAAQLLDEGLRKADEVKVLHGGGST